MAVSEDVYGDLVEHGVFEPTPDAVVLTDAFRERVAAASSRDAGFAQVRGALTDRQFADLEAVYDVDPAVAPLFVALHDALPSPVEELIRLLPLVYVAYAEDDPRTDGAPAQFLPVSGDRLRVFLSMYRLAIVYVWLDECEPCDLVCADLEAVDDRIPDDIALLSVFGPASERLLAEEFDVAGGPVVLFVADDEVDARLVGAQPRSTLVAEIDRFHRLNA